MDGMLTGLRVLDSTIAVAMPTAMHILGDMGAQVIKVESHTRPRSEGGSYPDNVPGDESWNREASFQYLHHSKLSVTINLKAPAALEAYKDLVRVSDVLVENNRAGTLARLGLGYDDLRKVRPDIILLSNTGFGQTGPWRRYAGIGTFLELITGVSHFTGYPDQGPRQVGNAWIDIHVSWMAVFSILAALHWRAESGQGQHIDFAMYQVGASTLGPEILDYIANGRNGQRMGNRHPVHAPHGVYPCRGDDKWVAIAVESDAQWEALCRAMGNTALAQEPRFGDAISRWHHQDEIAPLLSQWTRLHDPYEVMHLLQKEGVVASVVPNTQELMTDPHMVARGFYEKMAHSPESGIGTRAMIGRPWKVSKDASRFRRPAPKLGEHNEYLLGDLLGRTEAEIAKMYEMDILSKTPAGGRPQVRSEWLEKQIEDGTLAYVDAAYKKHLEVQ